MDDTHLLLLRACAARDNEIADAWTRWRSKIDWNSLDAPSVRVLSLLHRVAENTIIDDPIFLKLRGVARHQWTRAQITGRAFAPILERLRPFNPLIISGGAIADTLVGMEVRVMVHSRDAASVLNIVGDSGFILERDFNVSRAKQMVGERMRDIHNRALDIYWSNGHSTQWESAVWARAKTVGTQLVLAPIDALVLAAIDDRIHGDKPLVPLARVIERIWQVNGDINSPAVRSCALEWEALPIVESTFHLLHDLNILCSEQ